MEESFFPVAGEAALASLTFSRCGQRGLQGARQYPSTPSGAEQERSCLFAFCQHLVLSMFLMLALLKIIELSHCGFNLCFLDNKCKTFYICLSRLVLKASSTDLILSFVFWLYRSSKTLVVFISVLGTPKLVTTAKGDCCLNHQNDFLVLLLTIVITSIMFLTVTFWPLTCQDDFDYSGSTLY